MFKLGPNCRIALATLALGVSQPCLAQITPQLDEKIETAERKLDADIKACRPIDVKDYDALVDAALRNQGAMLKALGAGAMVDSVQAGTDRKRAEALLKRAQAAAAGPCKPPEKQAHPAPAPPPFKPKIDLTEDLDPGKVDVSKIDLTPSPNPDKAPPPAKKKPGSSQTPKGMPTGKPPKPSSTLLPKGKGEGGILLEGPLQTPFRQLRTSISVLFDRIDDAFDKCDVDSLNQLSGDIRAAIDKTQTMVASGTLSKDEAGTAEALIQDLGSALIVIADLRRCPKITILPEHVRPGPEESAKPKVDLNGDLPKSTLPNPDLSPMGTEGGPDAPQLRGEPGAKPEKPVEKPTPPKISLVDDLVEPPTPAEVRMLAALVKDLDKTTQAYPDLIEGCQPGIWDKHIAQLEAIAKRARQIAEWAKAPGQTTGVDPKAAQRLADDAQKAVDAAKRGKAANEAQWRPRECPNNATPPTEPQSPVKSEKSSLPEPDLSPISAEILEIHNEERAKIGVPSLRWDQQLADDASAYAAVLAQTRELAHAPREGRGIERENLLQAMPGWSTSRMMQSWTIEKRDFVPGYYPNVARDGNWLNVSHYTQMIWSTTTDIGCGIAQGGGFKWLVCRYSPGGNKDGKPVGIPNPMPEHG
jgi:hypothetical protein